MKTKLLLLALLLTAMGGSLRAQNSASGNISASSTNCTSVPSSCVWEQPLPPNAATSTINISGAFSATLLVEESNNSGTTWATAATLSSAGTTTYSTNGFTDIRVRCSAYVSGTAVVAISTGLNTGPIGPAGPAGGGISSLSSIPGQPGLTAVPVTKCTNGAGSNCLIGEYRLLPTENPCAALDYSGNNNNATGCDSTAPLIQAGTGGFAGIGTGSVILPAALNSAKTVQIFFSASHANGFLLAGNNSGGTNSSSIFITTSGPITPGGQAQSDGVIGGTTQSRIMSGWLSGGNPVADYPRFVIAGNHSIAWVMGASVDQFYLDGNVENFTYNSQRTSAGHQTSGAYELGGISSCSGLYVACGFYNAGNIYYAAFYNQILTAQELATNAQYLQAAMAARGVPSPTFSALASASGNILGAYNIVADGDSITCGTCVTNGPLPYTNFTPGTGANFLTVNGATPQITNSGRAGITMISSLEPGASQAVDPAYAPKAQGNVDIIWGGTNDAGTNMQDSLRSYCTARRAVGWKCLTVSMISRGGGSDATKNVYGPWMRQHWKEFADGFADMASDVALGADGANTSATFFLADNIHPTQTSVDNDEYPVIQRAVNRLYGNNDFSTATTYVAAALAATATTALTETGNIVTVTFGATPANCQVGNSIVIAGVTAAGYNSTSANGAGNGAWTILSRTATQVTYFDATTGLSAATVQGTGVCPQQQDKDVYTILNFGAGNFTLESCVGYTGQNLYIRNINAAATTLLPFASETITGAGATPTTLAANTTAILQSQLVSSSAAGCNWVRLQ